MYYQLFHLADDSRPGSASLLEHIETSVAGDLADQGASIYGTFTSLIGLASNELYLVTCGDNPVELPHAGFSIRRQITLSPTIRPVDHTPRQKDGLYVFRWFWTAPGDVDEIVRLSDEAWTSFEKDFAAEIQGLFVEASDQPEQMLLLTWYRDLSAWEESRHPSPAARENFLARHRLTRKALPIATRLHTASASQLVSHS